MDHITKNKKVLLGLSGGVDSAIAALILKKQGYQVTGAFMKNFSETKNDITGQCSWREDYKSAQKIAAHLNIPLIKFDFEKQYINQVIKPMIADYKEGITPNPDITCNAIIKFPLLREEAKKRGYDLIATGHYANIKKSKSGYYLTQSTDKEKDQTYFLYDLSQEDLKNTLFPIGSLIKSKVRKIAEKNKFPNFNRQSSRGVCFVGNIPLKGFLEKHIKPKLGKVLNENNKIIGKHKGAHYYTIGERAKPSQGIEIEKGKQSQLRFYVIKKDMEKNTITLAPENSSKLKTNKFEIKKVHWINPSDKKSNFSALVRMRHRGNLIPCKIHLTNNNAVITSKKSFPLPAPGQSAVFYKDKKVLGGGEIVRTFL